MKKLLLLLFIFAHFIAHSQSSWISLFDGKTLAGWKKLGGTATFSVVDGAIVGTTVVNSGNTFLATEKEYGDFILELDVKIDDTSSNSGVQLRSHFDPAGREGKGLVYGYQFEVDPGYRHMSGGIYDEGRRDWLYPGKLNPTALDAFKPGTYYHVKIECIGSELKTWINNTPVAYLVDQMDKSGFIALQVHNISNPQYAGEKVYFKNIRIKTASLQSTAFPAGIYVVNTIPNNLTAYEKQNGWKLLFDGKSSDGWIGAYKTSFPRHGWEIKDGELTILPSVGEPAHEGDSLRGGDIITKEQFSAFDLSFEFKFTPGANSGVKYFVTLPPDTHNSAIGLEYQVLDDTLHPDAKLGRNGDRTLSSLYDLIPAHKEKRFIHQPGNWNMGRVIVYPNNHVEHYLNGIKVLEYERGSQSFRDLVAISKYKIYKDFGEAKQGPILLQDHGNEVSFRSIKIKVLK